MKIAIFYDDGNAVVQFNDETFRKLLKDYTVKYGSIDAAIDEIESELKKQTNKF